MKKYRGTIVLLLVAFLLLISVTAYGHELYNDDSVFMNITSESKTYIQEEVADYTVISETLTAPAVVSKATEAFQLIIIGDKTDTGLEVENYSDTGVKELSRRLPDYSGWT